MREDCLDGVVFHHTVRMQIVEIKRKIIQLPEPAGVLLGLRPYCNRRWFLRSNYLGKYQENRER